MFQLVRRFLAVGTVLVAVVAGMTWPATAAADSHSVPAQYRVINLGNLGDDWGSAAFALNDRGEVVGSSTTASGSTHPFLWRDGVMTDLGVLDSSTMNWGEALDINNRGEVVGVSSAGGITEHAFLWRNGTMIDLGTLGGSYSFALSINDRGQVVGVSTTVTDTDYHGFLWADGVMTDLGVPAATAINDRGQITGGMNVSSGYHAYRWDRGVFTDIDTTGGTYSEGLAINKAGWVVGRSVGAFLWRNGTMTALPDLGGGYSMPIDINDHGLVLGAANRTQLGPVSYVIWHDGATIDLTDRGVVTGEMGVGTAGLYDINNKAQIAGSYYFTNGRLGAALFTR